jgi:predicted ATP-grasp superfamily ATP-dependent carboligase
MAHVTRDFVYPALIKPVHRYTAGFPIETAKVLIAHSAQEALAFFQKYPQLREGTLMQELIEGPDHQVFQCTALVNSSGEIAAYSTVRKLRQYPPGYGSMCYGRTERNEIMAGEALKLLRELGYRGLGSLEFKYRERDGAYYFIEMNTRLPWYNGLFADAGINLAQLAYLDLTGSGDAGTAPAQRDRTTWVSFHNYRSSARENSAGGQKLSFGQVLGDAMRVESYAWWNWADPAPFLASLMLAARGVAGALLRRLRPR